MRTQREADFGWARFALALIASAPLVTLAQAPVDDDGKVIGAYEQAPQASGENALGNEDIPMMSEVDLEELVGPIALYPDDLLAIVLPASAYPLQIVDAARFLEDLERDPSLEPDPEWDDSVVALLNYPEVVQLLNEDIDWTWRLGEAVVSQQADVVSAIETFRDRAYAAGNLKSDAYQNVARDDGVIEITPVSDDVIYVPYYEPERVVVYQPRPVYYYYPRSYPVYYYPYSSAYDFDRGYFWGVTTAFTIGWLTDSLHVYHHSYHGHPYYGYSYWDRWWYRHPSISVYNTTYVSNTNITVNRYYSGDRWRPRHDRRDYVRNAQVTRNRYYQPQRTEQRSRTQTVSRREPIAFRERPAQYHESVRQVQRGRTTTATRQRISGESVRQRDQTRPAALAQRSSDQRTRTQTARRQEPIRFRERPALQRESAGRMQQSRETTATRQGNSGEIIRQARQTRAVTQPQRSAVRGVPSRQTTQASRAPVRQATRQERREPVRQAVRQERREPVRQATQQVRQQQARPSRQASRESRPESPRAETRTRESRATSAGSDKRRAKH